MVDYYNFYWCCPDDQTSGFIENHYCLWEVGDWIRVGNEIYSVEAESEYKGYFMFTLTFEGTLDDQFESL